MWNGEHLSFAFNSAVPARVLYDTRAGTALSEKNAFYKNEMLPWNVFLLYLLIWRLMLVLVDWFPSRESLGIHNE